jgi:hypothetical protein
MPERSFESPPALAVTAAPIEADDERITVPYLCKELLEIDLDQMRRLMNTRRRIAGSRLRGPVQLEVLMMTRPLDLGFIVGGHCSRLAVRIAPEEFDQAISDHRSLYAQCMGILEILSTAPVGVTGRKMSVHILKLRYNESEEEKRNWAVILQRWKEKKQF